MNDYAWQHRNRTNTAYINGRRGSNNNNIASNNTIENTIINKRPSRVRVVAKPDGTRVYLRPNSDVIINNNNNNINNTRPIRVKPTVPVIRNNNTRPSYNSTRPSNNVRPRINNNNNTRSTSTNVNRSTNSRGGSGVRKN